MSTFDKTVAKLAHNTRLRAVLKVAPHVLAKEASLSHILGDATQTGAQKVMQNVLQGALLAGAVGAGTLASSALTARTHYSDRELGKLKAQSTFKAEEVASLGTTHKMVLKTLLKDDVISQADKSMITSAYSTMRRFAPQLAADENAARSFLRENAIYGTGPSYASLKNLADAEQAVAKSRGALPGG